MIKHHPSFQLLQAFVKGELPASLSAGVAIHADLCQQCQQQIAQLTDQFAEISFEEAFLDRFIVEAEVADTDLDFANMIDAITASAEQEVASPCDDRQVDIKGVTYTLPKALTNMELGNITKIGKLARSRIELGEHEVHTSLLHIDPGGGVPAHTHKGFELTVLLEGSFSDEHGQYVKGDFIMLDGSTEHHPESANGCLCYTVANDALYFTEGFNKLLNPLGSFLY